MFGVCIIEMKMGTDFPRQWLRRRYRRASDNGHYQLFRMSTPCSSCEGFIGIGILTFSAENPDKDKQIIIGQLP